MRRLWYLLGEALAGIRSNRNNVLIGVVTTAFTIASFGVFFLLYLNVSGVLGSFRDDIKIIVYLKEDLTNPDSRALLQQLESEPAVGSLSHISRKDALEEFHRQFPSESSLLEAMGENPLPASVTVTMASGFQSPDSVNAFVSNVKKLPGVEFVRYNRDWIDTLSLVVRYLEFAAIVVGGILALATVTIVSNTIRLSFYTRKAEIEILRLIGATTSFIAIPYIVEGALLGLLGGGLSLLVLKGLFEFFRMELGKAGWFQDIHSTLIFFPASEGMLMVLAGLILGCGSSVVSVYGAMKSR